MILHRALLLPDAHELVRGGQLVALARGCSGTSMRQLHVLPHVPPVHLLLRESAHVRVLMVVPLVVRLAEVLL